MLQAFLAKFSLLNKGIATRVGLHKWLNLQIINLKLSFDSASANFMEWVR